MGAVDPTPTIDGGTDSAPRSTHSALSAGDDISKFFVQQQVFFLKKKIYIFSLQVVSHASCYFNDIFVTDLKTHSNRTYSTYGLI